jgi:Ca-activated chloride channel family protein
MNPLKTSEIARRLAEREDIEPPEGLLEKIKAEIPAALPVAPLRPRIIEKIDRPRTPRRQVWLMAASVAAALGGGVLALHVMRSSPPAELALQERAPEKTGSRSAAVPSLPRGEEPAPALDQAPAERDAEESRKALQELGYLSKSVPPVEVPAAAPPPPPPPPAPKLRQQPAPLEAPAAPAPAQEVEGGVEGGVPGGVVGGVAGGVAGGVPGGAVGGAQHEVYGGTPGPVVQKDEDGTTLLRRAAGRLDVQRISRQEKEKKQNAAAPSTGGTAEPNDKPYGDVFFESAGVNPFIDTEDDRLSTFGLDVDTGSYTVARRYLRDGHLPPAESVRAEEFVNFFSYGDPAPARGDFALRAEGAPTPFATGPQYRLLRFNLRAREVAPENRKPAVLTFVIDVSGSMNMENRLGLVKKALSLLLDQLRASDRVGLVIYGDRGQVLLEPTSDHEAIRRAIGRLAPGGSTNAEEGLTLGYDLAGTFYRPGASNRIILCTDGVANVGRTGPQPILERIGREARKGIELTALGFGMGNYNDVLLEQLADKGDGRYAYIDDEDEARRVLVEELTGTLQTIAKDAKVQVDFNPAAVSRWRLIGYENRDIADEKFRDNSVDAGEIGAGHNVTALYEVKLKPEVMGGQKIATLHLRFRVADTGEIRETARDLRVADLSPTWEQASRGFRLASLVGELAEVLRGSYWAKSVDLSDLASRTRKVAAEMVDSPRAIDILDFARMVEEAARLKRK